MKAWAPAALAALVGAGAAGAGALAAGAAPVWLAAMGGAGAATATQLLAARTLEAPRVALLAGLTIALPLALLAFLAPPPALLALALAVGALLAARADDRPPLLPLGGPALALAATWASPALGIAALLALALLFGASLPLRGRLDRDNAPQLAGFVVAAVALLAIPSALLPVGRGARLALLVVALAANLLLASRLPHARLGAGGRRALAVALALLVPVALLGALILGERLGLLSGALRATLLVAGALVGVVALAMAVTGIALLLDTAHRAKGWILASTLGALLALPAGEIALAMVVPSLAILAAALGARAVARRLPWVQAFK